MTRHRIPESTWHERVAHWRSSGLTAEGYAREHDIGLERLMYGSAASSVPQAACSSCRCASPSRQQQVLWNCVALPARAYAWTLTSMQPGWPGCCRSGGETATRVGLVGARSGRHVYRFRWPVPACLAGAGARPMRRRDLSVQQPAPQAPGSCSAP